MSIGLPWHIVEQAIQHERNWLIETFDFYKIELIDSAKILSRDEMLRQISILIVNGRIKVCEFKTAKVNQLWGDVTETWKLEVGNERHGGEWHKSMIKSKICHHSPTLIYFIAPWPLKIILKRHFIIINVI